VNGKKNQFLKESQKLDLETIPLKLQNNGPNSSLPTPTPPHPHYFFQSWTNYET